MIWTIIYMIPLLILITGVIIMTVGIFRSIKQSNNIESSSVRREAGYFKEMTDFYEREKNIHFP